MAYLRFLGFLILSVVMPAISGVAAQERALTFASVERPPFAMNQPDGPAGFSVELMSALAQDLGRPVEFVFVDSFSEMLELVERGTVDGAIANISITADREERMDFSLPIFDSGLKVLVPQSAADPSLFAAFWTADILFAIFVALGLLFAAGMLMWLFERKRQPYFDRPFKEAIFSSFWWALNLVVNGGFEERMPQSRVGRGFAVVLVVSSLFLVSAFVAQITAAMTVVALQNNVAGLNDLDGRRVGTVSRSTAASLLENRGLAYRGFADPEDMFHALENQRLDAIVFDAPILAYYASQQEAKQYQLLDRNYRPEGYGIALPTDSDLREPINQALLHLRESGDYDDLIRMWFGTGYRP